MYRTQFLLLVSVYGKEGRHFCSEMFCFHSVLHTYICTYSVAEEISKSRSLLYHIEWSIPFPVTELIEMSNAVFRITVNHPNGG